MPAGQPAVILIDDNVEFAGLLGTLIAEQGMMPVLAHTAADGLRMLDHYADAVAIVLDLLLPDMTGQKLLAHVKRRDVPAPPIWIITGVFKGAKQREKIQKICPIQGWFEKPFDTRLLVERMLHVVGQEVLDRNRHARAGAVTPEFDVAILDPVEAGQEARRAVPTTDILESQDLQIDIDIDDDEDEDDEFSAVATVAGRVHPSSDLIPEHAGWSLDKTPTAKQMSEGLRTNLRIGDLEHTTAPALLQAFYIAQETGEIVFERGEQRKMLYFIDGCPVYAVSNQHTDRFGSVVKRLAGVPDDKLQAAIEEAKRTDAMLGDVLIERGLIDAGRRDELLSEQTRAIVRSVFAWTTGRYIVGFKPQTRFEIDAPPGQHPAGIILSGVRDLFELERLQTLIPSKLWPVPAPHAPFELYELPLKDGEAEMLLLTTGTRTIEEIASALEAQLTKREIYGAMYSLLTLGVVVGRTTALT